MSIRQKTLFIPDTEKALWTDAQLVTFMCELSSLTAAHMDDCKAEARKRVGLEGGKLICKDRLVNVGKQGQATDSIDWKALAQLLLTEREDRDELVQRFTTRKPPQAQRVTMK